MTRCMRRIIACFALFAVAWVALLPLVSSAHALVAGDSSLPPCHQAGLLSGVHTPSSADPAAPEPAVPSAISRMDLERAIEALPPGSKAAFLLHDVEGFEHREIAGILGISEGTSKSQVHKARLKLRALLKR